jgi:hypothetical protein
MTSKPLSEMLKDPSLLVGSVANSSLTGDR